MKEMLKKALSLVLAAALVFGICGNGLFVVAQENVADRETIKYVSLGDSMTNGIGLDGYNDSGLLEIVPETYPARFAAWLAGCSEDVLQDFKGQQKGAIVLSGSNADVHFTQLATSAMRIEDLRFILEYGTENAYPGDGWTDYELSYGDRFGCKTNPNDENYLDGCGHFPCDAKVALFQNAITEADIITFGAGNSNLGVYLLDMVLDVFGMGSYVNDSKPDLYAHATLENALNLSGVNEDIAELALKTYNDMLPNLTEAIGEEKGNLLANRVAYTLVSLLINYDASLKRIAQLNPDAEIIALSLMNGFDGFKLKISENETLDLGAMIGEVLESLNDYIVAQVSLKPYADTTVYYAETPVIECLIDVYEEKVADENSIIRDRFVRDLGYMAGVSGALGGNADIVKAYEADPVTYAAYAPAVHIYLAFERAILMASKDSTITMANFAKMGDLSAAMADVMAAGAMLNDGTELAPGITRGNMIAFGAGAVSALDMDTLCGILAAIGWTAPEATEAEKQTAVGYFKVLANLDADADVDPDNAAYIMSVLDTEYEDEFFLACAQVASGTELMANNVAIALNGTTNLLTYKLTNGEADMDLLYLAGRMTLNSGMGSHPTGECHGEMAEAIINAYETKHTAQEELIDNCIQSLGMKIPGILDNELFIKYGPAVAQRVLDILVHLIKEYGYDAAIAFCQYLNDNPQAITMETLKAEFLAKYENATHGEYVVSKDSYYVSLGDSTTTGISTGDPAYGNYGYKTKVPSSFTYKLAEELGLNVDTQYMQLAMAGLRPTDIRYILDDTFVPDDYALNRNMERIIQYAGSLEQMREDYITELSKADLITISMGSCNFSDFISTQMQGKISQWLNEELAEYFEMPYLGEALREGVSQYFDLSDTPYEMDWESYIGEDGTAALNETLAAIKAELIAQGVPENLVVDVAELLGLTGLEGVLIVNVPVADMVVFMAECYFYGYVTFAMDYAEVYNLIHEIAPDAELVIVGMYNPMDDLIVNYEGTSIPLGDYYGYFANAINLHHLGYAMLTPNTTFVSVPETESVTDAALAENGYVYDLLDYVTFSLETMNDFHATVAGHEYIKDQILNALDVTRVVTMGDVNGDGKISTTDARLIMQYTLDLVDETGLDLAAADVNGDGKISTTDARLIMQLTLNIITEFPVK